jgi:hypothetical protein
VDTRNYTEFLCPNILVDVHLEVRREAGEKEVEVTLMRGWVDDAAGSEWCQIANFAVSGIFTDDYYSKNDESIWF